MTVSGHKAKLRLGNAPVSWGVFEGDAPANPPWRNVLDEIAEAGYRFVELGPLGFLPKDPSVLRQELEARGLALSGGFVYEHLSNVAIRPRVAQVTREVCELLSSLEARYLVVIDRMCPERQRTAGRSGAARRLNSSEWEVLIATLSEIMGIAVREFGLHPVLHPHCGTFIEFEDEIDRAMKDLDGSSIGLCVDTGHATVAGIQPQELIERYGARVEYLHFKDVDGFAMKQMIEAELGFEEALGIGLFCPLGRGIVDYGAVNEALGRISFDGVATVEQDPDPEAESYSGLEGAELSRAFVESLGL